MNIREFKEIAFKKAAEIGFSEYEIYYSNKDSLEIKVYNGEVDGYGLSNTSGVSFRGIIRGKIGYAYSEILDEAAAEMVVYKAMENAKLVDNDDEDFIYGEADRYEKVLSYSNDVEQLSPERQIDMALSLEKKTKEWDKMIEKIAECEVDTVKSEVTIINSKGLDLNHKRTTALAYVAAVAKDESGMKDASSIKIRTSIEELNLDEIAEEAAINAISKIGSKPVESGKYRVVISNYMMATLIKTFEGIFYADNAQKGLSLLKGREGEVIASQVVTIIDNPLLDKGPYSTPFDDEGVATYKKAIVEKGRFNTLLYNLKTARKEGVKTTGNASKSSFSAPVAVSATNLYLEKGELEFDKLIELAKNGVYITDLQGMHSGANSVTGDFSLAANGRVIKDGKLGDPIDQITLAGNFFELLNNVEQVGRDFDFYYSNTASASVLISELSVAGL